VWASRGGESNEVLTLESGEAKKYISIHFQFENYQPRFISKINSKNKYSISAIVPNRLFHYFYSIDSCVMVNPAEAFYDFKLNYQLVTVTYSKKVTVSYELVKMNLHRQNMVFNVFEPQSFKYLFKIQPRTQVPTTSKEILDNQEDWHVSNSMFKVYRLENEEQYRKCLDFDFTQNKVPRMVKNVSELNDLKDLLRTNYKLVHDAYAHLAAQAPLEQTYWCIAYKTLFQAFESLDLQIPEPDFQARWHSTLVVIASL